MEIWNELTKSLTWGDLLSEYQDALSHCEQYMAANPQLTIPLAVSEAMKNLSALHLGMRTLVLRPGSHSQKADPILANQILSVCRRVMIDVPFTQLSGHA